MLMVTQQCLLNIKVNYTIKNGLDCNFYVMGILPQLKNAQ